MIVCLHKISCWDLYLDIEKILAESISDADEALKTRDEIFRLLVRETSDQVREFKIVDG